MFLNRCRVPPPRLALRFVNSSWESRRSHPGCHNAQYSARKLFVRPFLNPALELDLSVVMSKLGSIKRVVNSPSTRPFASRSHIKKPRMKGLDHSDAHAWHAQLLERAPLKHTPPRFEPWHSYRNWEMASLPPDFRETMECFARLIIETNARMNLTSASTYQDFYLRHVADSLSLLPFLSPPLRAGQAFDTPDRDSLEPCGIETREKILDVGTGGGLPGLVLASALPEKDFVLMDSVAKKAAFVEVVARQLGLDNVRVETGRVEAMQGAVEHNGRYKWVVARAVADLDTLIRWTAPLLGGKGGGLLAMKGKNARGELERARRGIEKEGMAIVPTVDGDQVWKVGSDGSVIWMQKPSER